MVCNVLLEGINGSVSSLSAVSERDRPHVNQNASAAATSLLPFLTSGAKITVQVALIKTGSQVRIKKNYEPTNELS